MADVFTPEQEQRINDIFIEDWGKYGSAIGSDKVHELTPEELTDEHIRTLTIPGMNPATMKWEQTSMRNMMKPVTDAIDHLETEDEQVQAAITTATTAASTANTAASNADTKATEASRVNCTLNGMTVTVTNRQGQSTSTDIGFDIYRTYGSVSAMNADAANVPQGKFVMIATVDPTDPENARLYVRNASTAQQPFGFLSDLDQASSAAWAEWLDTMKPAIQDAIDTAEDDHTTAAADHTQALSDHTRATSDHTQAGTDHTTAQGDHTTAQSDHTRAGTDHTTAQADHTTAGTDHTRAEDDHETADADHTQAGTDHTRAESDHGIAADDHTTAGTDHTRAGTDHSIAAADHTQAGTDHTTAQSDHTQAGTDHTTAQSDHTRAGTDHTTAQGDHTQADTDHTTAVADHTQAATDHTTANSDHTRAGTDHTTAASDHTQAGTDHTNAVTATNAANTQANRAKGYNDHPWEVREDGYIYVWDETTQTMKKTDKVILSFDDLTPEQRQQIIDEFYESLTIASDETCADIIDELT